MLPRLFRDRTMTLPAIEQNNTHSLLVSPDRERH